MKYFYFKKFKILTDQKVFPITTDSILLGALVDCREYTYALDIGTGTGILALFFFHKCNGLKITAIDVSMNAIEIAKKNFYNYPYIEGVYADVQYFAKKNKKKFDFIFSNPPYYLHHNLPNSNLMKLAKHSDFMFFKRLLFSVSLMLMDNGKFSVILPFDFENDFTYWAGYYGLYAYHKIYIKTKENKPINRLIIEFAKNIRQVYKEMFVIFAENGDYSKQYIQKVKNYLL